MPEERNITYFAFTAEPDAGRRSAAHAAGDSAVLQRAPDRVFGAGAGAVAAHPHQGGRGRRCQDGCGGQGQGRGILKQLQAGGNWADLAKKNSDDPGSKDSGGELGFAQRGRWCRSSTRRSSRQKIGDIAIVKSQFGYHIVQVEERQPAHSQALNEVLPTIQATLIRQKAARREQNYAQALTTEAVKNGLEKTAAAHHLEVVTTPPVAQQA